MVVSETPGAGSVEALLVGDADIEGFDVAGSVGVDVGVVVGVDVGVGVGVGVSVGGALKVLVTVHVVTCPAARTTVDEAGRGSPLSMTQMKPLLE